MCVDLLNLKTEQSGDTLHCFESSWSQFWTVPFWANFSIYILWAQYLTFNFWAQFQVLASTVPPPFLWLSKRTKPQLTLVMLSATQSPSPSTWPSSPGSAAIKLTLVQSFLRCGSFSRMHLFTRSVRRSCFLREGCNLFHLMMLLHQLLKLILVAFSWFKQQHIESGFVETLISLHRSRLAFLNEIGGGDITSALKLILISNGVSFDNHSKTRLIAIASVYQVGRKVAEI